MAELAPAPQNTLRYPNLAETDPTVLDVNVHDNIATKLMEDAVNRGRADLVGLSWQQNDQTFIVSDYDELLRSRTFTPTRKKILTMQPRDKRPDVPIKNRIPTIKRGAGGGIADGQFKRDWPGLRRTVHHVTEDYLVEKCLVDVYDKDGALIGIKAFFDDELLSYLQSHDNDDTDSPLHIDKFTWFDPPEAPPAELSRSEISEIDIPLVRNRPIFDQVMEHQAELKDRADGRFDDWVGLTWEHEGKKYQIVRDTLVQKSGHSGNRMVRTWIAKFYNKNNETLGNQTFEDNELREYFDKYELKQENPVQNPHWEAPNNPSHSSYPNQLSWAGWLVATRTEGATPTATSNELRLSRHLLSFKDGEFDESSEEARKYKLGLKDLVSQPANRKYVETLAQTIAELGYQTVFNLARDLRDQYLDTIEKLGLTDPSPDKSSLSGIAWGLIFEKYSAYHPDEDEHSSGHQLYEIGTKGRPVMPASTHINPFGGTLEAQRIRREMIDRSVAVEFMAQAFATEIIPDQQWTSEGQVITLHKSYHLKQDVEYRLQDFVKKDVMAILNRVIMGDVEPDKLSVDDLNMLGRRLREQFIQ